MVDSEKPTQTFVDNPERINEKDHKEDEFEDVQTGLGALEDVLDEIKPSLLSKNMIKLYFIMALGYLVSTINGFDSSLMGSINAMKPYQETFNLSGAGSSSGIIFIIYNLGQIAAFPFCGLLADGLGRRWCIFIGCFIILIGTAIQGSSHNRDQFMGGRFILGFGAALASAAAPAYVVELAHPAYRGTMAGMYNNFWWLGNILAGWTTYGTNEHIQSEWAWRIPTIVQAGMPTVVLLIVMFLPESPRWLIQKGRKEEALHIFAKYHGDGNPNALLVKLEYKEVVEQLSLTKVENPWWDFKELVNTRAARYRLFMVIAMSFFGQWSGNNVVSYFMPVMLQDAGITSSSTQLLLNAINPIFCLIAAIIGATMLDKFGRRPMLLGGTLGALASYILLTAFAAEADKGNSNMAYGVIVSIYIFGIVFSMGYTPLQTLYAVECLTNRTRAKGSGINFLFLNIAMVVNTYGISIAMEEIGWKLYLVYIGWLCVEAVVIYFFFVETKGKTLEELQEVFEARNPRKKSLEKRPLVTGGDA